MQTRSHHHLIAALAIIIVLLTGIKSTAKATDANSDGMDDLFLYYPDTQEVQAHKFDGTHLLTFPLPNQLLGNQPVVFSGSSEGLPVLFSIVASGKESILYKITSESEITPTLIGDLTGATVMLYDIDADGNSDLIIAHKTGSINIIYNILTGSELRENKQISRIARHSYITVSAQEDEPYIVVYKKHRKKRKTQIKGISLTSSKFFAGTIKGRLKTQLYPYTRLGVPTKKLLGFHKRKNGKIQSLFHYELYTSKVTKSKIPSSLLIVPGAFHATERPNQIFTVNKIGVFLQNEGNRFHLLSGLDLEAAKQRSASILTAPLYSFGKTRKEAAGSKSCDFTADGTDGPGGFLLKASDHDRNLVVLLPVQLSTTQVELISSQGSVIERLKYTGRSNGFRETHRGSHAPHSYPQSLTVKAYGTNSKTYCFKISNSHIRND